jgi:hypothetical protein
MTTTQAILADLNSKIAAVQTKARARTIDDWEARWFFDRVLTAARLGARHGIPFERFEIEAHGGGVANGYKYRAETTAIGLCGGEVYVARTTARSGAHGNVVNRYLRVKGDGTKATREACRAAGMRAGGGYWYL